MDIAIATRLREYARLDRQRRGEGLSPSELHRWETLQRFLASHFAPGPAPTASGPLQLRVSFATDQELANSLMTNVSRGGVFLQTDHPLELKTCFTLNIYIDEPRRDFSLPVEVVSVGIGPGFAHSQQGMGLRFLEVAPAVKKQLLEVRRAAGR